MASAGDEDKKKRKERARNFDSEETEKLMRLVKIFEEVIETKKSDTDSLRRKTQTWMKIAQLYNEDAEYPRPMKQLRSKYENVIKRTRQRASAQRHELPANADTVLYIVKENPDETTSDFGPDHIEFKELKTELIEQGESYLESRPGLCHENDNHHLAPAIAEEQEQGQPSLPLHVTLNPSDVEKRKLPDDAVMELAEERPRSKRKVDCSRVHEDLKQNILKVELEKAQYEFDMKKRMLELEYEMKVDERDGKRELMRIQIESKKREADLKMRILEAELRREELL